MTQEPKALDGVDSVMATRTADSAYHLEFCAGNSRCALMVRPAGDPEARRIMQYLSTSWIVEDCAYSKAPAPASAGQPAIMQSLNWTAWTGTGWTEYTRPAQGSHYTPELAAETADCMLRTPANQPAGDAPTRYEILACEWIAGHIEASVASDDRDTWPGDAWIASVQAIYRQLAAIKADADRIAAKAEKVRDIVADLGPWDMEETDARRNYAIYADGAAQCATDSANLARQRITDEGRGWIANWLAARVLNYADAEAHLGRATDALTGAVA